jgi:hypothetical protein
MNERKGKVMSDARTFYTTIRTAGRHQMLLRGEDEGKKKRKKKGA